MLTMQGGHRDVNNVLTMQGGHRDEMDTEMLTMQGGH